ncbi:MAG: hypothetical protein V4447_12360 [Pseudomonadota bacterium]
MRYLIFLIASCLALPAVAQVFRCNLPGGKVEYQATPCQVGSASSAKPETAASSDEGPAFPPRPGHQDLEVVGDERFQERVRAALSLLKSRDSQAYSVVSGYVGRIQQSDHSGMRAYADPPTFFMSDASAMYSVTWAAASIAHDAYHSKLYFDYRGAHPGTAVPDGAWKGISMETKCMKFQIAAMRNIGATQREIDHAIADLDGRYSLQERSSRKY